MTWLKVCVLSLLLSSQGFSSDWNFSPLRDQEGNIFAHGGGIERIIDLTFSEELDVFIIALKTNDSSLVVATSEDAQRWEIVSAEYWTWGYTSGKLKNHNGALLLLIGNGIFRWDYSTWTRSRIDQFEGRLNSLAVSPTTVVTAYSSTGTVYNSTDGGINYTPGIAAAGLRHVESIGDEFYAFHWSSTRDDVLMHSTDGSYFSILEALPEYTGWWKCIGKVGDRMILIRFGYDFSANTGKYEVLSREPSGVYRSLGLYNKTPTSQAGSWPERYLITDRGGIFTTSQNGILEFSNQGGVLNFTVHEEARMKLEWRGVASGNGISVLATKTGMLAIADFDLVGEGPPNPPNPSNLTYTTTNGEVTITDCDTAATGELVIPNTIGGSPVTGIGDGAFRDCGSLTSITIPDGVTSIGQDAFRECTSLTSITIPNSVTSIKAKTFENCTSLTSITIPDSVTSIGRSAFDFCTSLKSITIPESVTSIGTMAFISCSSLTSIEVSTGNMNYTDVEGVLFNRGKTLLHTYPAGNAGANYVIPDSVTSIGDSAFRDCGSLMSITIPNSVTSIGDDAFTLCTSLTSITIPNSVTSIGNGAFVSCTSLTSITIGNGVTSIKAKTFENCTSLTSITIPDSVTSIGQDAFRECTSLTSITIPDSVTSIGRSAFETCTSLTSITIPDGVTSIGNSAFKNCNSLTSVSFQGVAPTMDSEVFWGVLNGAEALVTSENQTSFGGIGDDWNGLTVKLFEPHSQPLTYTTNNGEVTITDCDETAIGELIIPDTIGGNPVTSIGRAAFLQCANLTSINIPDGVTSIGNYAFMNCTSLTGITIGNSVTSIGNFAFFNCSTLTSITFLGTAPSVGNEAFSGVPGGAVAIVTSANLNFFGEYGSSWNGLILDSGIPKENTLKWSTANGEVTITDCCETAIGELIIPDTIEGNPVTSIGERAFEDCIGLTRISLGSGITSIGERAFSHCSQLRSINIPAGVTAISTYTFLYCTRLNSVIFEANSELSSIGINCFQNCESLTSITIPDSVIVIEGGGFSNCHSLTSITLPNLITSIGRATFASCRSLTSITIPDSVTSIGSHAFSRCTRLTSITIPDGVTSIGIEAFFTCTSLTSMIIPDSVISIGAAAFRNCSNLTGITIGNSVTSIGEYAFDGTSISYDHIDDSLNYLINSSDRIAYLIDGRNASGSVKIPTSVGGASIALIADGAFDECTNLTSISLPDGVPRIGNSAFSQCTSLTSITIGNGVTSIGDSAFRDCPDLTNITIPDRVTSIGNYAFGRCTSLTKVTFLGTAPEVDNSFINVADRAVACVKPEALSSFGENGSSWSGLTLEVISVLSWITTNGEVTITDCDEAAIGEIIIPNTIEGNPVTSIGDSAFRDCGSLTSITIPDGVTRIGATAFFRCTSLTSMIIPDSVTSIGGAAFFSCTGLTSITIPDSVTNIGDSVFRNCSSLTSVSFQGVAPTLGSNVFLGVPEGAQAYVSNEVADSFGGLGSAWEGLTVAIQRATATITDCGFVNATTFFIEFEPAGAGYRVMSSPTLDFGNAVEVTPTLQPTSGSDNRFELTPDGSRNFYRLEPTNQ